MTHGTEFTHRGIVDNFWVLVEHLPWSERGLSLIRSFFFFAPRHVTHPLCTLAVPSLGDLTDSGHAFGITTAADDTTNPPGMQLWFHEQVPGSLVTPQAICRCL